jgi:bifunctional DNA-binding transcriptional regulator/antitoxin component of YhaV-PrlF toxin-antitoxin module
MGYVLTSNYRLTVPKAIKQALGSRRGQKIDYRVEADGQVFMIAVNTSKTLPPKRAKDA